MKNYQITSTEGKEYWISRSVAVCLFITKMINGTRHVLIERRGKGAADNQGKLCAICGYLDWDETLEQAAKREAFEETGFICDISRIKFLGITSDPLENRQNVCAFYTYKANENEDFNTERALGGEEDEVSEVFWMPLYDVDKIPSEKWAFGHDSLITKFFLKS